MNSPTDWMSGDSPKNCSALFPSAGRLNPVATGSMNTKSVTCRIENSLSTSPNGAGWRHVVSFSFTRLGPGAKVQPNRRRPRAAVEAEHDRPPFRAAVRPASV